MAAFALTEPAAGPTFRSRTAGGAGRRRFRAERHEGLHLERPGRGRLLDVRKRTGDARTRGVTGFALAGARRARRDPIRLLSPHPIGRLELDGVFVSDEHVLGEVDAGFRVAMRTLDLFRPSVASFAVGWRRPRSSWRSSTPGRRHAFGQPLREFQGVSHRLAEMATRTQAARCSSTAAARRPRPRGGPGDPPGCDGEAVRHRDRAVRRRRRHPGARRRALEHGHPLEHLYREVRAPGSTKAPPRSSARSSPASSTAERPSAAREAAAKLVMYRLPWRGVY